MDKEMKDSSGNVVQTAAYRGVTDIVTLPRGDFQLYNLLKTFLLPMVAGSLHSMSVSSWTWHNTPRMTWKSEDIVLFDAPTRSPASTGTISFPQHRVRRRCGARREKHGGYRPGEMCAARVPPPSAPRRPRPSSSATCLRGCRDLCLAEGWPRLDSCRPALLAQWPPPGPWRRCGRKRTGASMPGTMARARSDGQYGCEQQDDHYNGVYDDRMAGIFNGGGGPWMVETRRRHS